MSDAAERVAAWRHNKRREGYKQLAYWFPIEFKGRLETLAYARRQDCAAYIMDAVEYYATSKGQGKPYPLTPPQFRRLKADLKAELFVELREQDLQATDTHPPAAPLSEGMKQCKHGHPPYPATKKECPTCVRARKRRQRKRKTQATVG